MSLDKRIKTKVKPILGCHSDFDKERKTPPPLCSFIGRTTEKACEQCTRPDDPMIKRDHDE